MGNHSPDSLCELVKLYALGGLSGEEKASFERHVYQCANCQVHLEELRGLVELLPMASSPIKVPKELRRHVQEQSLLGEGPEDQTALFEEAAQPEDPPLPPRRSGALESKAAPAEGIESRKSVRSREYASAAEVLIPLSRRTDKPLRRRGYWLTLGGVLAAAVIGLGFYGYDQLKGETQRLQAELALLTTRLQSANAGLDALNRPAEGLKVNRIVVLNPGAETIASKGLAYIVADDKGAHLIVQAESLPELQKDQVIQVWLFKDNQPRNAGTFYPQGGNGAIYFAPDPGEYDSLSITVEPDVKGDKPRGAVLLAAGLKS